MRKLYNKVILPQLIHHTCSLETARYQRRQIIPLAWGSILEIGYGSGLNLPFYDPQKVKKLWAVEPSNELTRKVKRPLNSIPFPIQIIHSPMEDVSLEKNSMDTIVVTYSLCTIPDVSKALQKAKNILKPGGKLLFCEHGASPDKKVKQFQDRLNPFWKRFAGGCNLNRTIPQIIENAGFKIESLEAEYITRWRFVSFNYRGIAGHPPDKYRVEN